MSNTAVDALQALVTQGAVVRAVFPSGDATKDSPILWLRCEDGELTYWPADEDRDHIFTVEPDVSVGDDGSVVLKSGGLVLTVQSVYQEAQQAILKQADADYTADGSTYPSIGWHYQAPEKAA